MRGRDRGELRPWHRHLGELEYATGDKVVQAENDYDKDVYNGDLGFIRRIDPDAGEMAVDFEGRSPCSCSSTACRPG